MISCQSSKPGTDFHAYHDAPSFTVLIVGAAAAAIVWSVLPRPIPVETATVTKGQFVATVDEDGKTRVRERYVVAAPLSGRLIRIRLKVGDHVGADDVIATIAPSPAPFLDPRSRREAEERLGAAEATIERTKAAVERAQAQADQARNDLTRTRTLVEQGAATIQTLERAELAMRVADRDQRAAEFLNHAAEHELAQAKALLAQYGDDAKAPARNLEHHRAGARFGVEGQSGKRNRRSGGNGDLEIGDPLDLEIAVDVLSTDAVDNSSRRGRDNRKLGRPRYVAGTRAAVEPAAFTKISTLGVEEQRVNVLIDITSPPEKWRGLGDAYQVDTRITVFTQDDATIVPAGALFRKGDSWNVFAVVDGRAEARAVALLRRSGRFAAVTAGLSVGDRVIVYPSDRIASGIRVDAGRAFPWPSRLWPLNLLHFRDGMLAAAPL